jgi:hypothetical protein
MCGNIANIKEFKSVFPTLPGSATKPYFGMDVKVFN